MRADIWRNLALASSILISSVISEGCLELLKREGSAWRGAEETRKEAEEQVEADKDTEKAEIANSAEEIDRRSSKEINRYALWCIQRGMWNEARAHLEKGAALDSTSASIYNNLGIVYEFLGMEKKAEEAYERAVKLDPTNGVFRKNRDLFRISMKPEEEETEEEEGAEPEEDEGGQDGR